MKWPRCLSETQQNKDGHTAAGRQRYECKGCGKKYVPEPKRRAYGEETRRQAVRMIADGVNFRRTGRLVGVNHQTVINWFHAEVARLPNTPQPTKADVIEMDEVFTFVGRKKSKRSSSP